MRVKKEFIITFSLLGGLLLILAGALAACRFPGGDTETKRLRDVRRAKIEKALKGIDSTPVEDLLDWSDTAHIRSIVRKGLLKPKDRAALLALFHAARLGDKGLVAFLLSRGVAADGPYPEATPLIAASAANRTEIVSVLLKAGAGPDLADPNGYTPIMAALAGALYGQEASPTAPNAETVDLLLGAGADLRLETVDRLRALDLARNNQNCPQDILDKVHAAYDRQMEESGDRSAAASLYSMGMDSYRAGDLVGAERDFRESADKDPDNADAFYDLSRVLARKLEPGTRMEEALADPELREIGEIHMALGRAIGLDPSFAEKAATDEGFTRLREGYASFFWTWLGLGFSGEGVIQSILNSPKYWLEETEDGSPDIIAWDAIRDNMFYYLRVSPNRAGGGRGLEVLVGGYGIDPETGEISLTWSDEDAPTGSASLDDQASLRVIRPTNKESSVKGVDSRFKAKYAWDEYSQMVFFDLWGG
jgi:hypothetical protein